MAHFILPGNAVHLNFQQRLPDTNLRTWVQCLWSMGGQSPLAHPIVEKLYPDAGASLIIHLGSSRPIVTLCFNRHMLLETFDTSTTRIGIRFKPASMYSLLGLAPEQCIDAHLCLGDDIKPSWMDSLMPVVERLYQLDAPKGLALLETWLLGLLKSRLTSKSPVPGIIQAINQLQLPPEQLAANIGLTRRTLERRLKREVGVSPGALVTYARLNRARRCLLEADRPLSEIALHCGYYDQPHFTHAFQSFTNETPASYRQRKLSQIYKA
ncbi:helix-turn-helix transcriptional regulator [Halomonas citrativorans]|uniref:Helix-turn-helix transcriptional regulator n=1 Tax=Halomonas citrativorans TaxID=2742612 RepID=A0ABR9FDL2_9GAMM|nr:helix-turn-helix transcriptional regulator [Halomonas citrativorans]MBE0404568.1 helix-turn-helix transcriptional regulator [Halomonas citrativorans]